MNNGKLNRALDRYLILTIINSKKRCFIIREPGAWTLDSQFTNFNTRSFYVTQYKPG